MQFCCYVEDQKKRPEHSCRITRTYFVFAKEPYFPAKEPYISAKEPCTSSKKTYISAKEPYISVASN